MKTLQVEIDEEFVKNLLTSRNDKGETFLHTLSQVRAKYFHYFTADFTGLDEKRIKELLSLNFVEDSFINILSLYKTELECKTLLILLNEIFEANFIQELEGIPNNEGKSFKEVWNDNNFMYIHNIVCVGHIVPIKQTSIEKFLSDFNASRFRQDFSDMVNSDIFIEFIQRLGDIHPTKR